MLSGVEGRSKRASKPLHLVPLPSDHGAQRGEAYRKELKGRLRAAVPRSLRKLTFRVAGLDDPLVQLDSQKLRELEKLESWLIKHFPTEMSATPVCVPRERLRSLVERVGYASCPSGGTGGGPGVPFGGVKVIRMKKPGGKEAPQVMGPPPPLVRTTSSGRTSRLPAMLRADGALPFLGMDVRFGGDDHPSGGPRPPPRRRKAPVKRLKPSDEEEAEEEQPYDGEDGDDDENEEDDFDSGGGIFYGFDQLTRAASLTDPGMAPASGVAPTAPPLGSHAGLLAQLNAKYPNPFSSQEFTPTITGEGDEGSQPQVMSQTLSEISLFGSQGSPPPTSPLRGLKRSSSVSPSRPSGARTLSQSSLGRTNTDIFAPLSFKSSQETDLLASFGVGGPLSQQHVSGGDGIATFDVADGSLEEYDSQQMFSKKKRPVPKIPPELPGSQMSFLDGLDLGCGPLDTGRSSVYMDSPGLSSWTNVSALFRSGGGAGLHAVLATPGAVIGSSQPSGVKAETGIPPQPPCPALPPCPTLSPSDVAFLFGESAARSDPSSWLTDADVEAIAGSTRNWMVVCSAAPLINFDESWLPQHARPSSLPSVYDPSSLDSLQHAFYCMLAERQGSLTVEVVPGTAVALSQTMRQAPFQIAHLFVNSSPDGNSLLLESDGSTNAHAVAADCFLQGSTPPALLVICGANAKVAAQVLAGAAVGKCVVGVEFLPANCDVNGVSPVIQVLGAFYEKLFGGSSVSVAYSTMTSVARDFDGVTSAIFPSDASASTIAPVQSAFLSSTLSSTSHPVLVGSSLPRLRFDPWSLGLAVDSTLPLFGRAADLGKVLVELTPPRNNGPRTRLLCLSGPPGVGKSALALQAAVAASSRNFFPDGVAWVSVGSVSHTRLLPGRSPRKKAAAAPSPLQLEALCRQVSARLGLAWSSAASSSTPSSSLCQHLHSHDCLIVFECSGHSEASPAALALVSSLLKETPHVCVLLTFSPPEDLTVVGGGCVARTLEVGPLARPDAVALFQECAAPVPDSNMSSQSLSGPQDPPLPPRKRRKSSEEEDADSAVPLKHSSLDSEAVGELIDACSCIPGHIVHLARAVSSGSCDFESLMRALEGPSAGSPARDTHIPTLAARLVLAGISRPPHKDLLLALQTASVFPEEFTVEDVAQVSCLSEASVADALESLTRDWRVLQRDYRSGTVYRVCTPFVAIVRDSLEKGAPSDVDTVFADCATGFTDAMSPSSVGFSLACCPTSPFAGCEPSLSALMARLCVWCLEVVNRLQCSLVANSGQLSVATIAEFQRRYPLFQLCVSWLHEHVSTSRAPLPTCVSLLLTVSSLPLLHYCAPGAHALDLFLKQYQACCVEQTLIFPTTSSSSSLAPLNRPKLTERSPEPSLESAPIAGALQSPSRRLFVEKTAWLQTLLPSFYSWLSTRIKLALARAYIENGEPCAARGLVLELGSSLGVTLPMATLSRPQVPASGSASAVDDADCLDLLGLLASAAEGAAPESRVDSGLSSESSAHGALLEMSKAELLLIHASIVSTLSHDLQSALSCYQLVIGLLQNICPTNGRPPSSSLWTSSAGLPGYRHAHAVHAASLIASALSGLGQLHSDSNSYDQAISSFDTAHSIREMYLGPNHPDTAASLFDIGTSLFGQGRFKDAIEHLKQAHAIQLQALENTGKYEGGTGLRLADTLFSLSTCFRSMLLGTAANDVETCESGPSEAQLEGTVEHCLTLCLYLRVTLLGCHVSTMNAYAELADFLSTQRRLLRALACFSKAHEFAAILFEGFNNNCSCPHVDILAYDLDVADTLMKLRDVQEAERRYAAVLAQRQIRLGCTQRHLDECTEDRQDVVSGAILDLVRAQRHCGSTEKLAEGFANLQIVAAILADSDNASLIARECLERARFHIAAHFVPGLREVAPLPLSYPFLPSDEGATLYSRLAVDLDIARRLLHHVLSEGGDTVLMGYSPDGIALRRVYNKCRVTLGTVYRNLGRAKRSADPKVDVSAESARASAMFHSSLDYTMCGASGASSLERSVALNGIATYLYEQEGFEEALRCYGDALALQRMVKSDDQHIIVCRIETNQGLCYAKLASKLRSSPAVPSSSVSSAAAGEGASLVAQAKSCFIRALLAALPQRFVEKVQQTQFSTPSADGGPLVSSVGLWFDGPLSPARLCEPWLVKPISSGSALAGAIPSREAQWVYMVSLQTAFEAHRAMRNLALVEFELPKEPMPGVPLSAICDPSVAGAWVCASRAVAEAVRACVSSCGEDEGGDCFGSPLILCALRCDATEGLAVCDRLDRRVETARKAKP